MHLDNSIIQLFINFLAALTPQTQCSEAHKKQAHEYLIHLDQKLYPQNISIETWTHILFVVIQRFLPDSDFIINILNELYKKNPNITIFLKYIIIIQYISKEKQIHPSKKNEITELFIIHHNQTESPVYHENLIKFFIFFSLYTGKHRFIMQLIDHISTVNSNKLSNFTIHENWIPCISSILQIIQTSQDFYPLIRFIFLDIQLDKRWFPLLKDYPEKNIECFKLFIESKGLDLHSYIKAAYPDLIQNPPYILINEMKREFDTCIYHYSTDIEWAALNDTFSNDEIRVMIERELNNETVENRAAYNLLKICLIRGILDHALLTNLITAAQVDKVQLLNKDTKIFLALPKKTQEELKSNPKLLLPFTESDEKRHCQPTLYANNHQRQFNKKEQTMLNYHSPHSIITSESSQYSVYLASLSPPSLIQHLQNNMPLFIVYLKKTIIASCDTGISHVVVTLMTHDAHNLIMTILDQLIAQLHKKNDTAEEITLWTNVTLRSFDKISKSVRDNLLNNMLKDDALNLKWYPLLASYTKKTQLVDFHKKFDQKLLKILQEDKILYHQGRKNHKTILAVFDTWHFRCIKENTLFDDETNSNSEFIDTLAKFSGIFFKKNIINEIILSSFERAPNLITEFMNMTLPHDPLFLSLKDKWIQAVELELSSRFHNQNIELFLTKIMNGNGIDVRWIPILSTHFSSSLANFKILCTIGKKEIFNDIKKYLYDDLENMSALSLIAEMHKNFDQDIFSYTADLEWQLVDKNNNNDNISLLKETLLTSLSQDSIHIVIKLFCLRKMKNLNIFKKLLLLSDIGQFDSLSHHIPSLSPQIGKYFCEEWLKRAKNQADQTALIIRYRETISGYLLALSSQALLAHQSDTLKVMKKVIEEALPAEFYMDIKAQQDNANKALAELEALLAADEKKKKKKYKSKKQQPLKPAIAANTHPLTPVKKTLRFAYNPCLRPWSLALEHNKIDFGIVDHPVVKMLSVLSTVYKTVNSQEGLTPSLQLYGSTARLLFEYAFFEKPLGKISNDIDLFIHMPTSYGNDRYIQAWINQLFEHQIYTQRPIQGVGFIQFRFTTLEEFSIDLTFSHAALHQVLALPTIRLNGLKHGIGEFCIPTQFFNAQNQICKVIHFDPKFNPKKDLLNPRTLSFLWKQIAYLRNAEYVADEKFIEVMYILLEQLTIEKRIVSQAIQLFYSKHFPQNPKLFTEFFKTESVITLNPCELSKLLIKHESLHSEDLGNVTPKLLFK